MQIIITNHALQRFIERSEKLGYKLPIDKRGFLCKLLSKAKPENLKYHTVVRLMNNNYMETQYLTAEDWRFIISNGALVTVERIKKWQN